MSKTRTGHNRWIRDPEKENYWLKQMALWQESGLSVRAFCKEYGVVETSFYAWRRELIIRARESNPGEQCASEILTPNKLRDARGREIAISFLQTYSYEKQSGFAEKKPDNLAKQLNILPAQEQNSVTIITSGGYQIVVTPRTGFDLLVTVLRILQSVPELMPLLTVANSENGS